LRERGDPGRTIGGEAKRLDEGYRSGEF
jgi:hypothetical protein